jgi:hypothetical protein
MPLTVVAHGYLLHEMEENETIDNASTHWPKDVEHTTVLKIAVR